MKRNIKIKKKACYVKFTETIDLNKNPGYVWNKMWIFSNKWQKINDASDVQETSFKQMANDVINKLSAPSGVSQPVSSSQFQSNPFFDVLFTFAELN